MERRAFLSSAMAGGVLGALAGPSAWAQRPASEAGERDDYAYFASLLRRIAGPVLDSMGAEKLQAEFPVEVPPTADGRDRRVVYLECFGRTIAGAAPWLASEAPGPDLAERAKLRQSALLALEHSVEPTSPDYLHWNLDQGQLLVDSAFYTMALLRAPFLWGSQSVRTKARIVEAVKSLRRVAPPYTNWLLFAAINEAFLMEVGEAFDPIRLDLALRKFQEWYVGDGWFADGEHFAFDYYGSYVIHPMLLEVLEVMKRHQAPFWRGDIKDLYDLQVKRSQRFAEHLERLISPTGTYPPIGRSITYRTAAFQPLAQLAHRKLLPARLPQGQVRAALRAVHEAIFANPTNFTSDGFLRIGFAGADPALGNSYSNSGSMYLTTLSFLPLGLPAEDSFWTEHPVPWTQKRAFAGEPFPKDTSVSY